MAVSAFNYFNNNIQYIEHLLDSSPVTSKVHDTLVERLNEMGYLLSKKQEETNPFTQSHWQEIREKMVWLYGEIESQLWNHRLHQIAREASLLNHYPSSGNAKRVERVAGGLQSHIDFLLNNYAPALEEKGVISFAHDVLSHLASTTVPKTSSSEENENIDPSLIEEITDCLAYEDIKKAQFLFERLSATQKEQIATLLPQDMFSCLVHNIKTAANNHSCSLAKG